MCQLDISMARWLVLCFGLLLQPVWPLVSGADAGLQAQIDALNLQLQDERDQRSKLEGQINNLIDSVKTFMSECAACGGTKPDFNTTALPSTTYPNTSTTLPTTSTPLPTTPSTPLPTVPTTSISKSPHPAFTAGLSSDYDSCRAHETIVFDSVKLNVLSAYNSRTGVFTAPVSGTYAFTTTLSAEPNNHYHVAIVKGSVTNTIAYLLADEIDLWLERSTTVLTHLSAGARVWMACLGDSRIEGDHDHIWDGATDFHSHFSGFLINAD